MLEKIADGHFMLKKNSMNGGWSYCEIPTDKPDEKNPGSWVNVSGFIDPYKIKYGKLQPLGNGSLFLPVKAEIRKLIKKKLEILKNSFL